MMPAIRALTWEILARHRWIVGGSAVWLLVACLVAALLPESRRNPETGTLLLAPSLLGVILFIATVTHGEETRLEARGGGFPRRLLRLPVSTILLGAVPLALAVVVFSLLWVIASVGVLRPCGIANVPILWPGLLIGVVLTWLLALAWCPMPYRWIRLAFFVILLSALVSGLVAISETIPPEPWIVLVLANLLIPAVGLALRGVFRSRFEADEDRASPGPSTPREGSPIVPFRSRLRAQLWLEWRTHGRTGLLLTIMLGIIFVPVVAMSEYVRRVRPWEAEYIVQGTNLDPAWLPLFWILIIPVILAGAGGGESGRFAQSQKTIGVPDFVGLMPISTVDLVRGKFIASAIHLALMWVVLLAFALGWAILGGHIGGMADRLQEVCGSPALAWAALFVAVVGLFAITYLTSVGSMWVGLLGSPGFSTLPAFVGLLAISLATYIGQRWRPSYAPVLEAGLWFALELKLLLSACLVWHNLTRHRVRVGLLVGVLLGWAGLTALPAVMAAWLFGSPTIALAVVVLSPLASCLATPAFLHRSRHGAWA